VYPKNPVEESKQNQQRISPKGAKMKVMQLQKFAYDDEWREWYALLG